MHLKNQFDSSNLFLIKKIKFHNSDSKFDKVLQILDPQNYHGTKDQNDFRNNELDGQSSQ